MRTVMVKFFDLYHFFDFFNSQKTFITKKEYTNKRKTKKHRLFQKTRFNYFSAKKQKSTVLDWTITVLFFDLYYFSVIF